VDDEVTLVDLGSRNGTYVNGERVQEARVFRHGDRVTVGSIVMTVLLPESQHSPTEVSTQASETIPPLYVESSPSGPGEVADEVDPETLGLKRNGH
jgi:pSer/pThr/pTyr-binding forkhead associated (FHA) protein